MNVLFTVFSKIDGKIIRTGLCGDEDFNLQAKENESIAEGIYPDDKYYWDKNFVLIPEKPNEDYYVFDYKSKSWIIDEVILKNSIEARRNSELSFSDWTQLPDVPLTTKQAWADYRQALRDITMQPDPFNIVWPTKPE